jgi:uncharacterized protein YrrD
VLPSKKFLSLPIISLKEGQQIGYVRNLVVNPKTKSIAALVIDPTGFFKEQRIIPYNRVVSVGENAITVSTESQVEKATSLPDILDLLKDKAAIIGIKVVTENGKNLGIVEEFYIDSHNGRIVNLELSEGRIEGIFGSKAHLNADLIITIGPHAIIVCQDTEFKLEVYNKGLNENIKSFWHSASSKASEKGHQLNKYLTKSRKQPEETSSLDTEEYDDTSESRDDSPILEQSEISMLTEEPSDDNSEEEPLSKKDEESFKNA